MVMGVIFLIFRGKKKLFLFYVKINEKNPVFSKIFLKTPTHPIKKRYQLKLNIIKTNTILNIPSYIKNDTYFKQNTFEIKSIPVIVIIINGIKYTPANIAILYETTLKDLSSHSTLQLVKAPSNE